MKKFFILIVIIIIGLFWVNTAHAQNSGWWTGEKVGYWHNKADNGIKINIIAPYTRYKYYNSGILTLFVDGGFGIAVGDAGGFQIGLSSGLAAKDLG